MPNARVLSEKQAVVDEITERLRSASAGVFIDYKGINVAEDIELRRELKNKGVDYSVIKNTLTRFAFERVGFQEMDHILNGVTSLATSTQDPIAPLRIISDYSKKLGDRFNIKAGFMEGRVLSIGEILSISEIPSKESLYARVLGTMLAPISSLAVVLGQILEQKGGKTEAPAEAEQADAEPAAAESTTEQADGETEAPAEAGPAGTETTADAEAPAEAEAGQTGESTEAAAPAEAE